MEVYSGGDCHPPGDFSKKKQRKRCTAFIYIVQVFQLTFSPNVTLYYLSSYDVINLLCLCQNTMHGALLWRLGGFSIIESSVVFLWAEDLPDQVCIRFTFYFHLTLYARQVMMSLLYLCPCQDNGRLCEDWVRILHQGILDDRMRFEWATCWRFQVSCSKWEREDLPDTALGRPCHLYQIPSILSWQRMHTNAPAATARF